MKNIILLGATGSIGKQTIDVIKENLDLFSLKAISFGNNIEEARKIINYFHIKYVCCSNIKEYNILKQEYKDISLFLGEKGLTDIVNIKADIVINALVTSVGLIPTLEAIKSKKNILLANKETLVMAGDIVMQEAKHNNVTVFPIDSEHSAIYQCLLSGKNNEVSKIIITASGGAFRDLTRKELEKVTLEDALKHPNWSMGKKITIDCATMVNKGLEVIEAHHLYNLAYEKIDTVLHKESIIHSFVQFIDGSIIAQMSKPDMKLPISYALGYPNRIEKNNVQRLDITNLNGLTFNKIDLEKYPLLELAYYVGKVGGLLPTIYNASNEAAVSLFIQGKIEFLDIERIIIETVCKSKNILNPTIEEILNCNKEIKEKILEMR